MYHACITDLFAQKFRASQIMSVMNGATTFYTSLHQNNHILTNGLLNCYEILWIRNIDTVCSYPGTFKDEILQGDP